MISELIENILNEHFARSIPLRKYMTFESNDNIIFIIDVSLYVMIFYFIFLYKLLL